MNVISRTKNSIRSILFGLLYKILALILPFIVRTLIIYFLGVEYVGLSSLFTSILTVLNLAELGVGSAVVFSMYDAVAKEDNDLICSLLKLYKKIYRFIGMSILVIGLCITPFVTKLISGEAPKTINIYVLFLLFLINTVLTYFLFSYKTSLFIAFQRNDIISKISTVVLLIQNFLQIIVLALFKNYYLFVVIMILCTIFNNFLIEILSKKKYPLFYAKGSLDNEKRKQIISKIKSLFLYKVGGVVLTSVDSIIISAFLGLKTLGKYNNYYFIITSLFAFFALFYDALRPGVGNSIVIESIEKNKSDFNKLFYLNSSLVVICTTCLVCVYPVFMELWVGERLTYSIFIVILFGCYFFIWKMMEIVNLYKDAAGLWEYDKFRPIIASVLNIVLNLILVNFIGIYGIIISTILSIVFVIMPWSSIVLFVKYFRASKKEIIIYFIKFFAFVACCILSVFISLQICNIFPQATVLGVIIRLIISGLVSFITILALFSWSKSYTDSYIWLFKKIKSSIKKR